MSGIQARLQLRHPGFVLDVDLDLPGRGVTALFGHSGSGKTSCLRCLAGLERPEYGRLEVNGECWQDSQRGHFLAPHKRALGYVFQDANLFPHLSVQDNLTFGLKRVARAQRRVALGQAVELLGIGALLERLPANLSGGERQRVGIARALLCSPRLLLLDEPLASLDLRRRQEVLPFLERLHRELDIPMIYVSHAPDEVARLADHLVVLDAGRVSASGPLKEVLLRADLPFLDEDGAEAVIDGEVAAHDAGYRLLDVAVLGVAAALRLPHGPLPAGEAVRVKVRARDVSLALERAEASSVLNLLPVTVVERIDRPGQAHSLIRLALGGQQLIARVTCYSADRLQLRPGLALWAQVKSVSLLAPG